MTENIVEIAKVTEKGMITIPVEIRKRFNINPLDHLFFKDEGNGTIKVGKIKKESLDKDTEKDNGDSSLNNENRGKGWELNQGR